MTLRGISAVFVLLAFSAACFGGKLTATAEVLIEGIGAGSVYSATKALLVKNDSESRLELEIRPVLPDRGLLRKGFERIPDIKWVKTGVNKITLEPGQSETINVIISIPGVKKARGRRYQFHVLSLVIPPSNSGIRVSSAIESVFLVTTAK